MSVIIRDIKPPADCDSCWHPHCNMWLVMDVGERHPECPIVEVKGRLINADTLEEVIVEGDEE